MTFAERVRWQRAIEEVCWRHRIWPNDAEGSKPPLEAVVPKAAIEQKVRDYLEISSSLAKRNRAITPDQLKAEVDRMVRNSKAPAVLREIFAALQDDPELIAECVARPVLADRLASDAAIPETWKQKYSQDASKLDAQMVSSAGGSIADGFETASVAGANATTTAAGCVDDTWSYGSTVNAPVGRNYTTSVWTGTEMIVWGGYTCAGASCFPTATGGRYNPATDTWTATSNTNAPTARWSHTAIWTGTQMVVWGGGTDDTFYSSGGRYNPATNTWTATSLTNAPFPRSLHSAVWTGSEMIVWGGQLYDQLNSIQYYFNDGARYNPSTNTWTAISTTNAPSARIGHATVWTGTEMIVWGGNDTVGNSGPEFFNTGGRYNPSTNAWTPTSLTNAPSPRSGHASVWTGSEMIVWAGHDQGAIFDNVPGGKYKPSNDTWTVMSTANAPSHGGDPALWTGTEMIAWDDFYRVGGRYHPAGDRWTPVTMTNAPETGSNARVWTGNQMILWSGSDLLAKYCANSGVVAAGANITAESCSWSNGVIDPGETVTVDFCLRNSGLQPTGNLVATLQSSGGITNPSAAQSYGAMAPGGSNVCKSFTFAANGNPGDTVTATLHLQDGATDLGTVAYTFRLAAQQNLLTQSFGSIVYDFAGWVTQNNSQPLGTTGWFQGSTTAFPGVNGANLYIAANFQNTGTTGTISNWLLTPPIKLQTGTHLTFYTRTATNPVIPDRLQVRMSLNGDSTNVGATATSVGDFTTLLLDINPTYTTAGYPTNWTQYTVVLNGIQTPAIGRLAFRYFVENGGSSGSRSNYIGIDNLSVDNYITCAGEILRFDSVKLLPNHDILLECRGAPNRPNRVEISSDLIHYPDAEIITPDATGLFSVEFIDPGYDPKKFYRLRVP